MRSSSGSPSDGLEDGKGDEETMAKPETVPLEDLTSSRRIRPLPRPCVWPCQGSRAERADQRAGLFGERRHGSGNPYRQSWFRPLWELWCDNIARM